MKKCPFCSAEIEADAVKCRFCGEWLEDRGPAPANGDGAVAVAGMPGGFPSWDGSWDDYARTHVGLSGNERLSNWESLDSDQREQLLVAWKRLGIQAGNADPQQHGQEVVTPHNPRDPRCADPFPPL